MEKNLAKIIIAGSGPLRIREHVTLQKLFKRQLEVISIDF